MTAAGLGLACVGFQVLGRRERQNDSYASSRHAAFLADGVGALAGARTAADAAVGYYRDLAEGFHAPRDGDAPHVARELVRAPQGLADRIGDVDECATTLVGALVDPDGLLWTVAHGDSLLIHLRRGAIQAVTATHNRKRMLDLLGRPAEPGAAAYLTRNLGARPQGESDLAVGVAVPGDRIVLMSDGFSAHAPLDAVVDRSRDADGPKELLSALIGLLPKRPEEPDDNASCVVAEVVRMAAKEPDASDDAGAEGER